MPDLIKNLKLQFNPVYKVPFIWIKNRDLNYQIIDLKGTLNYKTSDTIFILGSGPSLNMLESKHLEKIKRHNSFTVNFSFLFDKILPTFHFQENGREKSVRDFFRKTLKTRRERLSSVVWLLSSREAARGLHPRLAPDFFPENPVCWSFQYPPVISIEENRPFNDEDFQKSFIYRGSITVVLHQVLQLGYKNIVLLGIDPDKAVYFYENMKEMEEKCKQLIEHCQKRKDECQQNEIRNKKGLFFDNMYPKGNKYHTIDAYYYALKDYLSRKHGINLFVGLKNTMLYPKLPAYFD